MTLFRVQQSQISKLYVFFLTRLFASSSLSYFSFNFMGRKLKIVLILPLVKIYISAQMGYRSMLDTVMGFNIDILSIIAIDCELEHIPDPSVSTAIFSSRVGMRVKTRFVLLYGIHQPGSNK